MSNVAESELPCGDDGEDLLGPRRTARSGSSDSRARIQLTFPLRVLISPLWQITR